VTRPLRLAIQASLSLSISAALLLSIGATCASASSGIERVWSFKGGAVDIVGQPNDTLIGVVTQQTEFSKCFHPVNEVMWTEMRLQADGSYWGFHQWYFEPTTENPTCVLNPTLGPTAWRVLENAQGESFLRVCFSSPGSKSQPTIAPDGSSKNVSYGCVDSASIASIPVVSGKEGGSKPGPGEIGFEQSVGLPNPKQCVRNSTLKIKLRDPKYDPFKEIVIKVNGKTRVDLRGTKKLKKAIVLRHLPSGSYTVKVLAITVLNQRLSGGRTYHSCVKGSGAIGLKHVKPKKHKR
jgi:hypothetical protein